MTTWTLLILTPQAPKSLDWLSSSSSRWLCSAPQSMLLPRLPTQQRSNEVEALRIGALHQFQERNRADQARLPYNFAEWAEKKTQTCE